MSIQNFFIRSYLRYKKFKHSDKIASGSTDLEKARKVINKLSKRFKPPASVAIKPAEINGIKVEWFIPNEVNHKKVLVYFHGGGYAIGSLDTHRALAAKIAEDGKFKVITVDYRLAPEHPYPAALEDAVSVYQWMLENGYYGYQLFVGGDSAGGGLTMALLLALKKKNIPMPSAAVLLSPWLDLTGTNDSIQKKKKKEIILDSTKIAEFGKWYAGDLPLDHADLTPLKADLSDLPPILIHVSSDEILLDDSLKLVESARNAGVEVTIDIWKRQLHVWHIAWQYLPEARKAIIKIGDYIRSKGNEQI
ncbi:MAG: alpha/beta hydrolase [Bacteroidota bacterium]